MSLEIVQQLVVIGAAIVGGLWALRRYWIERTEEAALEIGLNYHSSPLGVEHVVFFDISLANRGKVKIQAKSGSIEGVTFDDGAEMLIHSGSLQLKRLDGWAAGMNREINWFEGPALQSVSNLGEVNLLTEYENPKQKNTVDFWMEPGETYHLGATVVLNSGVYLAKVTFVGAGDDGNFWSRVTSIEVPMTEPRELSIA